MKSTCSNRFLGLLRRFTVASAIVMNFFGVANGLSLTWDGNAATAPNPNGGTGNWDTTSLNWWGTANVAWPTTGDDNDAIFANTAGTVSVAAGGVTVNDITLSTAAYIIQNNSITFNGTNPTITNAVAGRLSSSIIGTVTKLGAGVLTITTLPAGSTFIAGAGTTTANTGGGISGRVQINSGATFNNSTVHVFSLAAGNSVWINGGTLAQVNEFYVPAGSLASPGVEMTGGTWSGSDQRFNAGLVGNVRINAAATTAVISTTIRNYTGGSQAFNVLGGTVADGVDVRLSGSFAGDFGGGTTHVTKLGAGLMEVTGTPVLSGNGTFTLTEGKLRLTGTTAITNFGGNGLSLDAVNPVILQLNAAVVTDSLTFSKNISGGSAAATVVKLGPGTVTLGANASAYPAATVVSAGTLVIPETFTGSGAASVLSGATLRIAGSTGISVNNIPSLTLGTAAVGGGTLSLANFAGNPNDALLSVTSLNANGPAMSCTVEVPSSLIKGTGVFPLVFFSDSSVGGDGGFAALNLGTLPRSITAQLVDNSANGELDLNVSAFTPLVWNGTDATNPTLWDINTSANWQGIGTTYQETDVVVFDNTAASTNPAVLLNSTVNPSSITVNNASYSISGTGVIAGATAITKTGTGTLTLGTNNTYTGVTTLNGGAIVVGHANALGAITRGTIVSSGTSLDLNGFSIPAEPLTLSGTLVNNGTAAISTAAPITLAAPTTLGGTGNLTLSGGISGSFDLAKTGTGMLTIPNTIGNTGALSVNGGTLVASGPNGGTGALGNASSITINNGATIAVGGDNSFVGYTYTAIHPIQINAGGTLACTTGATNHLTALVLNGGTLYSTTTSIYGTWNFDKGVSTPGTGLTSSIIGGNPVPTQLGGTIFDIGAGDTLQVNATLARAASTADTGVIKNGPGAMVTTANTYTGATLLNAGSLTVPAIQSSVAFTAADDTVLSLIGTPGASFSTGAMTLGIAGATTLNITHFGSQPLVANAPVKVTGTLALNGTPTLNIVGSFTGAGVFPVVSYGSLSGAVDFTLGSLPRSVNATLERNDTTKTYNLNVSSVDPLYWQGAVSGVWNVNSAANWLYFGTPDVFHQTDVVVFDDSAVTTNVSLDSAVMPASVTISNSAKNYMIAGTGGIAGSGSLVKSGTGTLTLATSNTYSGGTTIHAGTLQLGNGILNGSVVGNILNNGSMVLNHPGAISLPGAISGTCSLTKLGGGVATLGGTNTYAGSTAVTAGTLRIGSGDATAAIAATSAVSIGAGATVAWDKNVGTGSTVISNVLSGSGDLVLQGYNAAASAIQVGVYELTGNNAGFGGRLLLNRSIAWNNGTPTKLGSAEIVVQNLGSIALNGNTFSNKITVENGAGWHHNAGGDVVIGAIRLEGLNTLSGNIVLTQNTGVISGDNSGSNSVIGGWALGTHNLTGVISGTGEFSMSRYTSYNGGTNQAIDINILGSASNTYTGKTVVDGQGALASMRLGKTGGAVAIQGGTTVQFGTVTGGQANLRMLQNEQFGTNNGGVIGDFVNASGQWMRFELIGTTQTLSGIKTGNLITQGSGVTQNGGITGNNTPYPGTLKLNVDPTDPRYPVGGYVYNGHLRNQDAGTAAPISLIKEGSGTQTLVGTVIDYTGPTSLNAGKLGFVDLDDLSTSALTIASGTTAEFSNSVRNFVRFTNTAVSGTGTLVKSGTGLLVTGNSGGFARWNMAGGLIDVREGEFRADYQDQTAAWVNNRASMNVMAGATVSMVGGNLISVDALSGGGTVLNMANWGVGVFTVGTNGGGADFSGVLKDTTTTAPISVLALTKVGAGNQTLSGVNTYTGATTINGGTLTLAATGSIANSAAVVVASGALFDVSATSGFTLGAGKTLTGGRNSGTGNDLKGNLSSAGTINVAGFGTPGVLTVSGDLALTGGNLQVDASASTTAGNDKIVVGGALSLTGTTTVTPLFSGTPVVGTPYTLMSYSGGLTGDASNLVSGIAASRVNLAFDTTSSPGNVLMTATGSGKSLVWAGTPGTTWVADATIPNEPTQNWTADAVAQNFQNLDSVTFDGTSTIAAVALATTVVPGAVTVNSDTTAYAITGVGSIAGGGSLTKSGTAAFQLATANSYSGGTTIQGGTLRADGATAMGTGPVTIQGGATLQVGMVADAAYTITNRVTMKGGNLYEENAKKDGSGIILSNPLTIDSGTNTIRTRWDTRHFTLAGGLAGSGDVTMTQNVGDGTYVGGIIRLTGASSYTGTLTVTGQSSETYPVSLESNALAGATLSMGVNGRLQLAGGNLVIPVGNLAGVAGNILNAADATVRTLALTSAGANSYGGVLGSATAGAGNGNKFGLLKSGSGTLTLSADNNFTGSTRITGGVLAITNLSALSGSTLVRENLGGTLDLSGLPATGTLNLGGLQGTQDFSLTGLSLNVGDAGNTDANIYSGAITLTGSGLGLTKSGAGSLILEGSSALSYSGTTTVSGGNLGLSKVGGMVLPGPVTMVNNEGARLYPTVNNQFAPGAVMTFTGTAGHSRFELMGTTQTLAGIDNSGGLTKGVIQAKEGVVVPLVSPLSTLILDVPKDASYAFNGYIRSTGGTLAVVKNGPGTQTLEGANITYSGGTTLNDGTLNFRTAVPAGPGTMTINYPGILTTNLAAANSNLNGPVVLNGARITASVAGSASYGNFTFNSTAGVTVIGTRQSVISADVRMGGNATVNFNVGNTGDPSGVDLEFTGKVSHYEGATWGYMSKSGAGVIRFNNPNTTNNVGSITVNEGKVILANMINNGGNGGLTANLGGTIEFDPGSDQTFANALKGAGVFNKVGSKVLTLGAASTCTGPLNLKAGKLAGKIAGAFGAANAAHLVTVETGTTLEFQVANTFGGHNTTASPIVVNGGTITNFDLAATSRINNGLGSLTLNNGTLTSIAGNSLAGDVHSSRPSDVYGAWGLNGTVTSTGTSLITTTAAGAAGRVLLSSLGTDTQFAVTDGTLTVATALQGGDGDAGGLNKTGAGKLVLSAVNVYRGPTTVTEGTLELTGSLIKTDGAATTPSNITVAAAGTLMGTGVATGTLTANGIVAPGSSIGTLSTGAAAFGATSTLAAEINANTLAADKLAVTGDLAIDPAAKLNLTNIGVGSPATGKLVLITYTGAWNSEAFAGKANGSSVTVGASTYSINYADTDGGLNAVTLTFLSTSDPFSSWADGYGLTGDNARKSADPDGDGFNNLLEFATNSDPTKGGSGPRVYPLVHTIDTENVLTYTMAVRKAATFAAAASPNQKKQTATKDMVKYTVEAADDLAAWTVVEVTEVTGTAATDVQTALGSKLSTPALGGDWEWHTFRTDGGTATDPGDFIHLKVEDAP